MFARCVDCEAIERGDVNRAARGLRDLAGGGEDKRRLFLNANRGALPGWTPMATTIRPQKAAAARTTSTWPFVIGSNEPA